MARHPRVLYVFFENTIVVMKSFSSARISFTAKTRTCLRCDYHATTLQFYTSRFLQLTTLLTNDFYSSTSLLTKHFSVRPYYTYFDCSETLLCHQPPVVHPLYMATRCVVADTPSYEGNSCCIQVCVHQERWHSRITICRNSNMNCKHRDIPPNRATGSENHEQLIHETVTHSMHNT
jgi:hypothetical protein